MIRQCKILQMTKNSNIVLFFKLMYLTKRESNARRRRNVSILEKLSIRNSLSTEAGIYNIYRLPTFLIPANIKFYSAGQIGRGKGKNRCWQQPNWQLYTICTSYF